MIIDAAIYELGNRRTDPFRLEGAREACRDEDTFAWIGLFEPDEAEFEAVRAEFDLHELAVEDAIHAHQRPKLERYDDTLFVVLKPARYVDPTEVIRFGEILLFIHDDFAVVVRHRQASRLVEVRKELEKHPEDMAFGPGAVLLAVTDRVVDDYAKVLAGLEADIDELEDQVFSDEDDDDPTERIYKLKRQVLQFHQATQPLLDPLERLARGRFEAIDPELREYFRDVHDHLTRVVERISAIRDLLTSILEANLTQVSVRQNEDMRKISAWVAIAAVPTLLAGVWGMNFSDMPELSWSLGYPVALVAMAAICGFLYRRFKASGWL